MSAMAHQITSLTIVYSTVDSGADRGKHQSSASLAFVRWIRQWPVNSPRKGPVTREMFPFDDVIMLIVNVAHGKFAAWYMYIIDSTNGLLGNTLRPSQNGRYFADDIFKCIFLNENACTSLMISLKFVPKVRINNIPVLVQIVALCRPGDKPLSEPMMVSLLTHICVTRPQWVNMINVFACHEQLYITIWA